MKRTIITVCIAAVTFLLALGITLYPLISRAYNDAHQSQIHTAYQERVDQADTGELAQAWERAEAYNRSILPGTRLTEAFSQEALLAAAQDYETQLQISGSEIMGYVRIPKIQVELPIYHGTTDATLERGVGHLLGSSLPVGGDSTHTVLTAHSGMAGQVMFSDLPLLEVGDLFFLEVLGETLAYQVDRIKTVLPYDTTYLGIVEGQDYATLVTCTPFGVNTHRLLVRGSRIEYEEPTAAPEEQPQEETIPESTWEQEYRRGLFLSLGVVLVIGIAAWLIRRWKHGA